MGADWTLRGWEVYVSAGQITTFWGLDLSRFCKLSKILPIQTHVKASIISLHPKPFFIESLLPFRYVWEIMRFHRFKIVGSYLEKLKTIEI